MANAIDACLNDQMLELLALEQLPAAQRETALTHLETCDACARRVSAMPCDDQLVRLVRQAGASPAVAPARPLVDEIRQLWPGDDRETLDIRFPVEGAKRGAGPAQVAATTPGDDSLTDDFEPPALLSDFLAPPQRDDELGRLGPYRALEVLGAGGMGVVLRAEDELLRRQIALKVMLPRIARDPNGRERFLREARAAAAVKHHHVVTIYQVDEAGGIPFLAMELLKGESLEKRLSRDGRLPIAEIVRIGKEIADGLAAAHELDLVHRDIKPANIWLESKSEGEGEGEGEAEADNKGAGERRKDGGETTGAGPATKDLGLDLLDPRPSSLDARLGRVKILDFGLACGTREDGRLTRKGVIIGTAAYMSPEQARGLTPDARGDLFSLGCVLYVMCAGEKPYPGTDFISTLVAVVSHSPRHIGEVDPSLPAELANLIMQLLEKDPADRPQSARDVARKLAALEKSSRSRRTDRTKKSERRGSGSASTAKTISIRKPARPFLRRPLVLLGLTAALGLLAAGGTWLALIIFRPEAPHGTAFVKLDDRKIQAKIDKNVQLKISLDNDLVALVDLKDPKANKAINLKVGRYAVELLNAREWLKLKSPDLTIEEGKRSEIELVFVEPKAEPLDKFKLPLPLPPEKPPFPPPLPDEFGPNDKPGPPPPPEKKGPKDKKKKDGPPFFDKDKGPKGVGFVPRQIDVRHRAVLTVAPVDVKRMPPAGN